ncbi:MAG: PaaI family thioesterase [Alphaproteobacteria bacterium]
MSYASFIEALGITWVEVSKTRILAEMEAGVEHTNGADAVHGGIYMAFADTLGARGAIMNLPDGAVTSTLESKTNFLRGSKPGKLIGEATPVHIGRTTQVWQTVVTNEAGKKLAVISQTQIVMPGNGSPAAERQQAMRDGKIT